ncbi:MAG: stage III sporulation protein AF [Bacteroidales bacterium]|nr:stage III sporulation protein AF [Bacteroidales bacterium]MCM1415483.1 stage III sporulation protein AF [bacterium]MCM1423420.1 stage III sporulation protein AF [bacterium]
MLKTIREIGIFMIVAQAVVHFAPGRQYEKYIKSISGVIILLLFLRPFVQRAGGQWKPPSEIYEQWKAAAGLQEISAVSLGDPENGVENAVMRRMEEEMAERLNRELAGETCAVKRVHLTLEEDGSFLAGIVLGEREADGGGITVEEITVGKERERAPEKEAEDVYRQRFAALLEFEEERVEVRWDG